MVAPVRHRFDFAAYVLLEQDSQVKHEFLDGLVWAMAGGSPAHSGIAANIARLLGSQLEGRRCRVFNSDLRIRVKATGLATYPGVTVVCGQLELDPDDASHHTVTNPKLIVEVLSPSTEDYDRGEKLEHYRQVPSLEAVLLVAQDAPRVEAWNRTAGGWSKALYEAGSTGEVASLDCHLAVDGIYHDPLA